MKKQILIIAVLMIMTFTACRSLPPVAPTGQDSAAIGVVFEQTWPVQVLNETRMARGVFFVRLDGDNMYTATRTIHSTWHNDGRVYLLNAEPGEYVAVATTYVSFGSPTSVGRGEPRAYGFTTFLSKETIAATRIRVEPGKLNVMGRFRIKMHSNASGGDEAQQHYRKILAADYRPAVGAAGGLHISRKISTYVGPQFTKIFKNNAVADFKGTVWSYLTN